MNIDLRLGDCLEVLKTIPNNSVDSIITDPPYGLAFMNKKWDYDVPSQEIWEECLRVLKPGGHLLSFGGSRTYHRMAVSVEDAGFEIRDQIIFVYGSGFPKSHNIGKAIDKIQENEREVIGIKEKGGVSPSNTGRYNWHTNNELKEKTDVKITKGNSEWEGWGTALKPAHEDIVLAKKDGEDLMDIDTQPGFYYGAKASKKDRNEGLDGMEEKPAIVPFKGFPTTNGTSDIVYERKTINSNNHPTVKPTDLMRYLIKLITPPNGTVLDPFMGSGSTGKAAIREGMNFIGIEREPEYFEIAKARIEHEKNKPVQTKLL